jgi:hypothetical protein
MKEEDFVPGPAAEVTDVVSGVPNFERSFNMATIDFQNQFVDLCKEVDTELKPDPKYLMEQKYGINPQLTGQEDGVLGDTSKATGKAYGIQCFMKGFQQFQNVSKEAADIEVPDGSDMSEAKRCVGTREATREATNFERRQRSFISLQPTNSPPPHHHTGILSSQPPK